MITETKKQVLEKYNIGLALYKSRQWKEAMDAFKEALQVDPKDGPSRLYLDRCKEYLKNPPGEDWDGVFIMKTK